MDDEPRLSRAGRHIKDVVYGANDGIVTTFAVVAGVTGGRLSLEVVLTIGLASLLADGFSMAASDYLGTRSEEAARKAEGVSRRESRSAVLGAVLTFVAFVTAGAVPLLPYLLADPASPLFFYASLATAGALAGVGALRALVTRRSALLSALEMLAIGGVAAAMAFFVGHQIHTLTRG
jgi:VIT1/CCC1 family predicted Fe2+/Mn2+ transporter